MTNDVPTLPSWAPDACTLPAAERPLRRVEFDDLFAGIAEDPQRLAPHRLRLLLGGGHDLERTVRDLTARETECCSFFTFTVAAVGSDLVQLDIEVPAAQVGVLDALAARVEAVRGLR
jgi:hypothetical protein